MYCTYDEISKNSIKVNTLIWLKDLHTTYCKKVVLSQKLSRHAHNISPKFYHNRMNGIGTHRILTYIHIHIYKLEFFFCSLFQTLKL